METYAQSLAPFWPYSQLLSSIYSIHLLPLLLPSHNAFLPVQNDIFSGGESEHARTHNDRPGVTTCHWTEM